MNLAVLHNQRFFAYLSLFTWFMVLLVTANNFLLMFVGFYLLAYKHAFVCSYPFPPFISFYFNIDIYYNKNV